ncbi:hypothetical protein DFJ74DRAFT_142278 [Hyaloraphidium curvatum]|nr:hypothetical protein DFJ74DRAFT_142278 [Hyaloraphidium curvatum]
MEGDEPGAFACDICGRTFGRKQNAVAHRQTHFPAEKAHACELCGSTFVRVYELKRHLRTTHNQGDGTRPTSFACDMCGSVFPRSDVLARHLRRSAKRPCVDRVVAKPDNDADAAPDGGLRCGACGATFTRRDALVRHAKRFAGSCSGKAPVRRRADSRGADGSGEDTVGMEDGEPSTASPSSGPASVPANGGFALPQWSGASTPGNFADPQSGGITDALPAATPAPTDLPDTWDWQPVLDGTWDVSTLADHTPASPLNLLALAATPMSPEWTESMALTDVDCACCGPSVPRHHLHDLYPDIPAHLLPPLPLVNVLIAHFHRYDGAYHSIFHIPSFRRRVENGTADPLTLASLMQLSLRMLDEMGPDAGGWRWAWLRSAHLRDGLSEFCRRRFGEELAKCLRPGSPNDLAKVTDLARAATLGRLGSIAGGSPSAAEYHNALRGLFPMLRFGELPEDGAPCPPDDVPGWIAAQERTRLCCFMVVTEIVAGFFLGGPLVLTPSLRGIPWDAARGRFAEGWANMPMSVSDLLFDSLDPSAASVPPHPAPLPLGLYFSWMDIPSGDPLRTAFLERAIGGLFESGCVGLQAVRSGIWGRFRRYEDLCAARGYALFRPPESDPEATGIRDRLVTCLEDLWAHLPERVRTMDEAGDANGLTEVCSEHWGAYRAALIPQMLVFFHATHLLLHAPYDILGEWPFTDPSSPGFAALEDWPFSDAFIVAESHAITISRLVKSAVVTPGGDLRKPDVRGTTPLWPTLVVRACWVHVIAIRKFRHILRTAPPDAPATQQAMSTVAALLQDIVALLADIPDAGNFWKHFRGAFNVICGLLERDQDVEDALDVWVRLTSEEAAVVKGRLSG